VLPEANGFWRKSARLVVGGGYLGLVVVHRGGDPDQRRAGCRPLLHAIGKTPPLSHGDGMLALYP
jgi:hypothetical protein